MKNFLKRLPLILIPFLLVACNKEDSEPVLFEHFQREVFNENLMNDIVVDSKNNKWITSYAGLLKYDNQKWTVYNRTSSNSPSDTLFDIAIDSKDNIYCLTLSQKIVRFDGTNWSTLQYKDIYGPTTLCIDNNDNLWVAAYYGLHRFNGTQWVTFRSTLPLTYTNHWANEMIADNNNTIWIACEQGGLLKFDGTTYTNFTVNQDVPKGIYKSVGVDNTGIVWVGAMGAGVFRQQGISFDLLKRDLEPSLCNTINSICFDKNQNCWLGTEKGILKYDGSDWTSFLEFEYNDGLPIKATAIDQHNDIWALTDSGVYKIFN